MTALQSPVPGPRPGRAVHRLLRRGPGQRRHRGREDPAPEPSRECLRGTIRACRPGRGHRPDADLRRTTSAAYPGRVRGATTADDALIAASPGRPDRPPRRRPLPAADQAPARPRWPHQRIQASCLEAQVEASGRVLAPQRSRQRGGTLPCLRRRLRAGCRQISDARQALLSVVLDLHRLRPRLWRHS